jgi:ADP-heptose:LPS heptosyltransferase
MEKPPHGIFGGGSIKDLIGLIGIADVVVCNNSGPLHLAAALGTPTVSVMGPTVKERWMPIGSEHVVLRDHDLSCIGCNRGYCRIGTHDCMKNIAPSMVVSAAAGKL